jgi:hypothetical protein
MSNLNLRQNTLLSYFVMLLSKVCVYGLRASLFLASNSGHNYVSIRKMGEKLEYLIF